MLRRDGACEQRGRFERDDGRFDEPGEVFGACAGAALYRRDAVLDVGGFDERFFTYLEDVDLALRLRLAGWGCRYEPVGGPARRRGLVGAALAARSRYWVERNTAAARGQGVSAALAALVAYRQLGWAWHALRERRLAAHLRGALAALPLVPAMLRERRAHARAAPVPVERSCPRGRSAGGAPGGHRSRHAAAR